MPGRPTIFRARGPADRVALNAEYDTRRGSPRARGSSLALNGTTLRRYHLATPLKRNTARTEKDEPGPIYLQRGGAADQLRN
jgi:hypothetical protein